MGAVRTTRAAAVAMAGVSLALALALGLTACATVGEGAGATATTAGGKAAPAFSGITLNGETVGLDQYKGKPLLLVYMTYS